MEFRVTVRVLFAIVNRSKKSKCIVIHAEVKLKGNSLVLIWDMQVWESWKAAEVKKLRPGSIESELWNCRAEGPKEWHKREEKKVKEVE